ncbi:hypothetical protein LPJ78_004253 [Coemansia sp. RSA 989]|nr:ATP-NAD kinase-like domain-containing protein [Coemansia mojavensis]KAJ1740305.1 hypothetical protein LPJ68_003893 [Coemansia sp. RSA 1086]KAJ1748936.1 hypothetical protein LPJ79_004121 [Coemansia sp. RSA 1821]KAJ1863127.1 hypothetical protein LPJ78_004253 [Coemansia sp. RSA 989]KAJ2673762.1 hypothetical protein IWW42_002174 [Coemansia sp. RSA 1085]
MPGAIDISDIVANSGSENMLLIKSQAKLYSSQGVLTGLLALYRDKLMWSEISDRSANMLTIATDVMFGATLSPPGKYKFKSVEAARALNREIESSTHFTVYTLTSRENGKRPMCDTWTFMVDSEEESATWLSLLRYAINPKLSERESNVLIFVNPVSGKRKSLKLFQTVVKPILEIGNTAYTLQITQSQGSAVEFVKTQDLTQYTAIVAVSGDGLLHEILNGLLSRPDWSKLRSMPLGVIPTGTGNGLAKTLDCFWPEQAAVSIVKAQTRPIDIMSTTLASGYTEYCFLSVTWGLIADIDIESERMRWAGAARLDLYGTLRLMNLRYYGGRLHYLPAPSDGDADEGTESARANRTATDLLNSTKTPSLAQGNNQGTDIAWGLPAHNFASPLVRQSPKPLPVPTTPTIQPAVTLHPTLTAGIQLPVKPGSLSSRWRTIEGPFVQVIATNVSWLSGDFLACQKARISDGAIDLVYSGNASKWNLIPYMAAPTRDNYMNTDDITHVRARAFILEPTGLRTTSRSKGSFRSIQPSPDELARPTTSRPLSMPLFGSRRSRKSRKSAKLPFRKSVSPQAPVPARVRSQAYTSYHQQTIGQGSSLRIQGLDDPQANGVPQPPAQAIFSVRSETELAATALNESGQEASLPSASSQQPISPEQQKSPTSSSSDGSPGPLRANKSMEYDTPTNMTDSSEGGCQLIGNHGILDLDGEVAELGPIKVECLPSLALVICPPWLNESQTSQIGSMPAPKFAESIRGTLSREGSVLSFNV